ncbi:hypothetical protein LOK49_LG09G01465 [Camellia lanceoleosa]|uniref:Uncharacterized protein n=1 Tax=Camellia lanceoleosa TaxID=1840588 RepID=A0ACC0GJ98_9ERIC|nr:hypothetical protein LOK49_LG09G01465 [Camellia lanceoleosa]
MIPGATMSFAGAFTPLQGCRGKYWELISVTAWTQSAVSWFWTWVALRLIQGHDVYTSRSNSDDNSASSADFCPDFLHVFNLCPANNHTTNNHF